MDSPSRRDVMRIAAAAITVAPLTGQPLFFTPRELKMVDELSDIIIPTDDHSPGARAANAAGEIDRELAESFDDKPRQEWRDGLKAVDHLCTQMHKSAFLEAPPEQRVSVVARMARNEDDPKKREEQFFHRLKGRVALAYYSSKIGIHQEMEYKGNTILEEFAGFDAGLVTIQPAPKPK